MPKHHQKSINKAPLAQGIFFYLKSCLETTKIAPSIWNIRNISSISVSRIIQTYIFCTHMQFGHVLFSKNEASTHTYLLTTSKHLFASGFVAGVAINLSKALFISMCLPVVLFAASGSQLWMKTKVIFLNTHYLCLPRIMYCTVRELLHTEIRLRGCFGERLAAWKVKRQLRGRWGLEV